MDGKSTDIKEFLEFVYSFYKTMKEQRVQLVYEGEITHQITKAFTSLTETNMELDAESQSTQKKVFHVMVECLQNVGKHADCLECTDSRKDGRGTFILCKGNDEYTITTGNIVNKIKIPEMVEVLEKINSLDKEGLKQLYKQQIKEGRLSNKGGAGLGFIDIAKKTGNPLYYNFLSINEEFSFFVLTSVISRYND
ncbi:MAG TPA: hypothetical protein DCQ26_19710 [Marinilabiliales bacterium]|jgi:hypothetical protein|nr:SiaB family protein kinase [Salinivirgaceae bacterium]OFX42865.1 MAG: hypothetical protein A2W95_16735 [Bacteroidetes bacterium GWA2_40_14]OFX62449.1 MAG: hypothetical protein A2W84_12685 [Bacteroidetes bacterium GWC2_40_13]OFX72263.1 MAG: hypothetical protein A2W96_17635 [Bacteroidetes bacterium GWD2_40_43]OFX90489.1 MAG: hypothetical protein A2W97_01765 [Bacteroidetes bacterium GWE2_40_63]OFY17265.1 MAG: hypothetical protein A2W88_15100 [Bacteroidetes bacterium GWF2_40_13]OFZ29097.1 MAG: